eukprot:6429210-Pyramimonas_sp.AAC.1
MGPGYLGSSRDTLRRRLSPAGHRQAHRLREVRWTHHRRVFNRARLRVSTFSGSCWSTCKELLQDSKCELVFLQEHKLLEEGLSSMQATILRKGWHSYAAPATVNSNGSATGGTMVCIRKRLDSWGFDKSKMFLDVYVVASCGQVRVNELNRRILTKVWSRVAQAGAPFLLGLSLIHISEPTRPEPI